MDYPFFQLLSIQNVFPKLDSGSELMSILDQAATFCCFKPSLFFVKLDFLFFKVDLFEMNFIRVRFSDYWLSEMSFSIVATLALMNCLRVFLHTHRFWQCMENVYVTICKIILNIYKNKKISTYLFVRAYMKMPWY